MIQGGPELPDSALPALRAALDSLQGSKAAMPHREVIGLSSVDLNSNLTVDFHAAETLGYPLVVLRPSRGSRLAATLSPRELEAAEGIALGLANKEIARKMGISLATVKEHVHRILTKTGLPNRAAIATALHEPD